MFREDKRKSTVKEEESEEPFSMQFFEDTTKDKATAAAIESEESENAASKQPPKKVRKAPKEFFGDGENDLVDYYSQEGDVGHPEAIDNEEDAELIKELFSDTQFLTKEHTIEKKKFIEDEEGEDEDGRVGEVDVKIEDPDEMVDVQVSRKRPLSATTNAAWVDDDDKETLISLGAKKLRKLRTEKEVSDKAEGIVGEVVVDGNEYQRRLRAQLSKTNKKTSTSWATLPSEIKKQKQKARDEAKTSAKNVIKNKFLSAGFDEDASEEEDEYDKEEDALEDTLLRSTEAKVASGSARGTKPLRKGILKIARLRDANSTKPAHSIITSLEFHPEHPEVLMTSSLDRNVSLFQIDGKNNAHVTSVLFHDLPVYSAKFVSNGDEIVVTGRRPFFYSYDVPSGKTSRIDRIIGREERAYPKFCTSKDGKYLALYGGGGPEAVILSAQTKQLVSTLRMSLGTMLAATFNHDGSKFLASGVGGEIYEYDMRTMRCCGRYADEGSIHTSAIAMSAGSKYLGTGSNNGVVNIYSGDSLKSGVSSDGSAKVIKPEKPLMNLTTPIDRIVFNHDAQIVAMSSHDTFNSLRLVHLPSYTVFSNWPMNTIPLQHVSTMAFSPNGGFFVVGNNKGRVLTFRLFHYPNA